MSRYFRPCRGTYKPEKLVKYAEGLQSLKVEVKDFIVLDTLIFQADLVISHCGAGILLECLRSDHATCLAVVNDSLMGNHQSELADKLSADNYIYQSVPSKVLADVKRVLEELRSGRSKLTRYPPRKEQVIVDLIDELLFN